MTCPRCSAAIEPDSRFCRHCGAAIEAPAPQSAAPAAAAPPPAAPGDKFRDPVHEQDIWSGRPCWRADFGLWLLWFAGSIALIYVAARYSEPGSEVRTTAWVIAGAAGLSLLVRGGLLILGTGYRLTTQRLFIRRGILSRVTDQLELVRVDDVRLRQGIIDRLVGTGDLEILGSDRTDEVVMIGSIDNPAELAERLRGIVRASRGKGTLFVENV